jgi:hypothetical protein
MQWMFKNVYPATSIYQSPTTTSTSAAHAWRPVVLADHDRHVKRKDTCRDALTEQRAMAINSTTGILTRASSSNLSLNSYLWSRNAASSCWEEVLEESRFAVKPKFCDAPPADQTKARKMTVFTD